MLSSTEFSACSRRVCEVLCGVRKGVIGESVVKGKRKSKSKSGERKSGKKGKDKSTFQVSQKKNHKSLFAD